MTMLGERDDDFFDFSEQIFGNAIEDPVYTESELSKTNHPPNMLSNESEVHTSYLLVNTLMNLLIKKGVIRQDEVQLMLADLHKEYMKKKGRSA